MIQKTVKAAKLVVRFTALAKPLAFFKVKLAKVQKPIKRKVPVPGPYIPSYIPTNNDTNEHSAMTRTSLSFFSDPCPKFLFLRGNTL